MRFLRILVLAGMVAGCGEGQGPTGAAVDFAANAARWADEEFQPSTLTRDEQLAELAWFTQAAEPFRGMSISVVSETLTTHEYESRTLARAFQDITGITVTHDLIQEGDVIEKLQTQMQSGQNVYDAYGTDSPFPIPEKWISPPSKPSTASSTAPRTSSGCPSPSGSRSRRRSAR
jgi:glycerol transport system substrate-binding protein